MGRREVLLLVLALWGTQLARGAEPPATPRMVAVRAALERLREDAVRSAALAADAERRSAPDAGRLRKLAEIAAAEVAEAEFLLALETADGGDGPEAAAAARTLRTIRGREIRRIPLDGNYVVVVSHGTSRSDWRDVVRALVAKYGARVVIHEPGLKHWRDGLATLEPLYACFVARPTEIGTELPADIHENIRRLDADPLMDAIWAVLTGADADSAFGVAANDRPLVIHKAMGGCYQGIDWGAFDEWMWWYEGEALNCKRKLADGSEEKVPTTFDNTHEIIAALNARQPDIFFTSGHGNHDTWSVGYGVDRGHLVSRGGTVYGVKKGGQRLALDSPNPKVYVAFGNCLIGLVRGADSMVPSWVKSGHAYFVAGYTVERSDWNRGVSQHLLAAFFSSGGRYTFGQAYYLSIAGVGGQEQKRGFCLYGDPAWDVRLAPRKPLATWRITEQDGVYTVTVDAPEAGPQQQVLFLPHWLRDYEPIAGQEHVAFTADNQISVSGTFPAGTSRVAVFRATRAAR